MFYLQRTNWVLFFNRKGEELSNQHKGIRRGLENAEKITYFGGPTPDNIAYLRFRTTEDLTGFSDYKEDFFGINQKLILMLNKVNVPFVADLHKSFAVFKDKRRTFKVPFKFVKREDREFSSLQEDLIEMGMKINVNKSEMNRVIKDARLFNNVIQMTFKKNSSEVDVFATDEEGGEYKSKMDDFDVIEWNFSDKEVEVVYDLKKLKKYLGYVSGFDYDLWLTKNSGFYITGKGKKRDVQLYISPIVKPPQFEAPDEEMEVELEDMNEELVEA